MLALKKSSAAATSLPGRGSGGATRRLSRARLTRPQTASTPRAARRRQLVGHRHILGKPVREALPEVADQGFFELLDRVYGSGETYIGHEISVKLQRRPDGPPEERFVNFVYQPTVDHRGNISGIFVEGSRLVLDFAFDVVGAHRLEARAAVRNGRGNGALRKIGAVQEGVLRRSFLRHGEYLDQTLWSLLGDEWRDAKAIWGQSVVH